MSTPIDDRAPADARYFFAEERTFLAWIRTGLALMTFGFVVARFGLYLAEVRGRTSVENPEGRFSVWFGTLLIVVGVVATLFAVYRHVRVIDALNRGQFTGRSSRAAIVMAVFLALVGVAMAIRVINL
jgi:putative membrane protein